MAEPELPIPFFLVSSIAQGIEKSENSKRNAAMEILAAAIVNARGKPTSIKEVLAMAHDINCVMYPAQNHGVPQDWGGTKTRRLAKTPG